MKYMIEKAARRLQLESMIDVIDEELEVTATLSFLKENEGLCTDFISGNLVNLS